MGRNAFFAYINLVYFIYTQRKIQAAMIHNQHALRNRSNLLFGLGGVCSESASGLLRLCSGMWKEGVDFGLGVTSTAETLQYAPIYNRFINLVLIFVYVFVENKKKMERE